ncbi:MAG: helix-turn-helix domain-containing protein, partial [Fulvivirga sp.]|uniref:helix-turn-helix domain-containing protein n=1 Tax=Fulvivirga sp. TaxID=1931237 RepID=UPI0032EDE8FA
YFGTERASAIAREVVLYLRRGEGDPQLSIFLQYRNHLEDRIHTIQEWLIHHFNEKNNIESLAEKVFMSPRNLVRLFKRTTGITIGQYIDKLRLEHASKLLSDNYKIEYVSQACGFNSSDQLRHLFKKYKFSLPSEFKSR